MNHKKKQTLKISVLIASIFIIFLSITYAFINQTLFGTKRQVITTGDIQVELEEGKELTINDAMPMYDEVGKIQKQHFDFQVVNHSRYKVNYTLYLSDITDSSKEKLSYEDVKYYLVKEEKEIKLEKLSDRTEEIIDEGTIEKNSTIHYTLRLWIDSEVTENSAIEGKTLSFKLVARLQSNLKEEYTISYVTGTEQKIGDEIKTEGEDYQITSTVPTKDNNIFLGWSTTPNGSVEYLANSLYIENKELNLFAVWKPRQLYHYGNQYTSDTGGWQYTRVYNTTPSSDGKAINYASEITTFTKDYIQWSETGGATSSTEYHFGVGYFQHKNLVRLQDAKKVSFTYTLPTVVSVSGYAPAITFSILDKDNKILISKMERPGSANNNLVTTSLDTTGLDLSSVWVRINCSTGASANQKLVFRLYSVSVTY